MKGYDMSVRLQSKKAMKWLKKRVYTESEDHSNKIVKTKKQNH